MIEAPTSGGSQLDEGTNANRFVCVLPCDETEPRLRIASMPDSWQSAKQLAFLLRCAMVSGSQPSRDFVSYLVFT
jgi:hypothetical protein